MLIRKIRLENILSFGPEGMELELRPLNVLVGPNGCGKSNLFDVLRLLSGIPKDFEAALRKRPLDSWLWRGGSKQEAGLARISADIRGLIQVEPSHVSVTAYECDFGWTGLPVPETGPTLRFYRESVQSHWEFQGAIQFDPAIERVGNRLRGQPNGPDAVAVPPTQSILHGVSVSEYFSTLDETAKALEAIAVYSDWEFGRTAKLRGPNETWRESVQVLPDYTNLWLALHTIVSRPESRKRLEAQIPRLYDDAKHYISKLIPGTSWVQGNIEEASDNQFPPFVLSDGTIRYLMLCALLLSDTPPALIALDEPELGLHPDLINGIAEMIKDASTRTQIIITTHSPMLLDAFTDDPESVVACDKFDGRTQMKRLTNKRYKALDTRSLGHAWMSGALGGTRW